MTPNNELINAAKDQAAREIYQTDFRTAVVDIIGDYYNGLDELTNRAMEIYAEGVNENSFQLSDIRNKLSPIKNIIAMIENGLVKFTVDVHPLVSKEIENCKTSIEYLTNKPTKP